MTELVTVAEYAKRINRTTQYVYTLIRAGKVETETWGPRATLVKIENDNNL